MDSAESNKELWGWVEEECSLQREARNDITCCLWDGVDQNEDDLLSILGEQTPVHDSAEFGYLISENGDKESKYMEEPRESSQLKRRRMLQFDPSDIGIHNELLTSSCVDPKIGEDSLMSDGTNDMRQWVLGFSGTQGELDQSSECWLASCFNENMMHFGSDEMNVSCSFDDHADVSEQCDILPQIETVKGALTISTTPSSNFKVGRKSYLRTPTKMTSFVAYPFTLIKPCGVHGDLTLRELNQRICAPTLSKSNDAKDEDSSHCYPTSSFPQKSVVIKTKIRTEGKGSITIMRTIG